MIWPFRKRTRRCGTLWPVAGRYLPKPEALREMVKCGYAWDVWQPSKQAGDKVVFILWSPVTLALRYIVLADVIEEAKAAGMPFREAPIGTGNGHIWTEGNTGACEVPDTLGLSPL